MKNAARKVQSLFSRAVLSATGLLGLVPKAVLAAPAANFADHIEEGYPMYEGWGWGHMVFGSFLMVLFWALVIGAIVLLVRWLARSDSRAAHAPSAEKSADEILQERFARGEIDGEDFMERRRVLLDIRN